MFYLPLSFSQFCYFPSSIFYSHLSLLLLIFIVFPPPPHFYCFPSYSSFLLFFPPPPPPPPPPTPPPLFYCFSLLLLLLILLFFLLLLISIVFPPPPHFYCLILNEKGKYKDIKVQVLKGGRGQFGFRFLNQIKWAAAKFSFQYLLRIDDDYFLCLKRLLSNLALRPKQNLVWGFFHCEAEITWLDEAFMIFSEDIIQKFLAQNESSMLCHPHADQQVMLWLSNILHKTYFHDTRLHHQPPASFVARFSSISNVCDSHLGAHGVYGKTMYYLGLRANDSSKDVSTIPGFARFCNNTKFDHRVFNPEWRYEPKPCKG